VRAGPISAGWKSNTDVRAHIRDIISSFPMLAVPGWLEAHRLPKPVAVASALKNTPAQGSTSEGASLPSARHDEVDVKCHLDSEQHASSQGSSCSGDQCS
jgi:hypothetical protein